MTAKATKPMTLEELWDWEAKHPEVFPTPRTPGEAGLIAELDRLKSRRRARAKAAAPRASRRKPAAA
jgi:hypothetical protein